MKYVMLVSIFLNIVMVVWIIKAQLQEDTISLNLKPLRKQASWTPATFAQLKYGIPKKL